MTPIDGPFGGPQGDIGLQSSANTETDAEFLSRLEQAKLDAMKELAYGASHEINNPLANIAARAQTLLRDEAYPERRRALESIHQQAMRAHEMISDLMLFARPPKLQLGQVYLTAILSQAAADVADECCRREIVVTVDATDSLPAIEADGAQLLVAIGALCRNAIEAIGRRGRVELGAQVSEGRDSRLVAQIEVRDDGPGISPDIRSQMFNPFFSGREAGRGLGFGLSKAWRIVADHGGTLAALQSPARGMIFRIELPCSAPAR